ncbi:hypothetical protein NE459_02070 [[Clostridium] innocuum]|uniref:hypothetical protein n=1 Tax=Clostridium innocuum TaxID=1522 RepID=UPI002109FCF6|nr:hypothetical protein [[Clostridium] innocuum]MCQ4707349.1 hypothetical protein [[Clostridium] innocuum]
MLHTLEKGEYPKGHRYWSNATVSLYIAGMLRDRRIQAEFARRRAERERRRAERENRGW